MSVDLTRAAAPGPHAPAYRAAVACCRSTGSARAVELKSSAASGRRSSSRSLFPILLLVIFGSVFGGRTSTAA